MLGSHEEAITYRKAELKTFVALGVEDKLEEDEVGLLGSVLEFSGKTVSDVMVSRSLIILHVSFILLNLDTTRKHVLLICGENSGKQQ